MLDTSPLRVKNISQNKYSTAENSKATLPARERDFTKKYS